MTRAGARDARRSDPRCAWLAARRSAEALVAREWLRHQRPRRLRLRDARRRADPPLPRPAGRGAARAARPHDDAEPRSARRCASPTARRSADGSSRPGPLCCPSARRVPRWRTAARSGASSATAWCSRSASSCRTGRTPTHVTYRLLDGPAPGRAGAGAGAVDIRAHEGRGRRGDRPLRLRERAGERRRADRRAPIRATRRCACAARRPAPPARAAARARVDVALPRRAARGYDGQGPLRRLGLVRARRSARARRSTLIASTESWDGDRARSTPGEARALDDERRAAPARAGRPRAARTGLGAELVLAADQFVITPRTPPRRRGAPAPPRATTRAR